MDDKPNTVNQYVASNYSRLRPALFILPAAILALIAGLLYAYDSLSPERYVEFQREAFFSINTKLSQYPTLQHNLTQMGNALISLSFLTIFVLYAPRMWGALASASILSTIISNLLKRLLSVPRPATVFDNDTFTIIGEHIHGYASCPSGHSITVFTTLTILMFAFMPQKAGAKSLWCLAVVAVGLILASSRVGVGAHHPLDVLIGSTLGFLSGLLGIFLDRRFPVLFSWIANRRLLPIFILLFLGSAVAVVNKVLQTNLIIFYLSLISLIVSLYAVSKTYLAEVKRKN